ncbi:hypothetical protein N9883_00385 [Flavobacteriaceae bacterium]|nr:hypothetical protein [Flavobacteriaceae bacterium]
MFAKIFKRLTIQAFITSFFLCFLAIFFVTYCVTAGNIDAQALIKTMFLWVAYAIIIVTISFLESRRLNQPFAAIHLLSIPLCILLFNQQGGFSIEMAIVLVILLITTSLFSNDFKKASSTKALFLLGVLVAILAFINIYYSVFIITSLLILFEIRHRQIKNVIALFVGVILTLQLLWILFYVATGSFFYDSNILKSELSVIGEYSKEDIAWSATVFIALLTATIFRLSNYKTMAQRNNTFRVFQFMRIWLIISIFFRFLNINEGNAVWLESFIPTAFFLGIAIDAIKNGFLKNLIIMAILFSAISLKLFNYDLISF